jgi:hypothetical protein
MECFDLYTVTEDSDASGGKPFRVDPVHSGSLASSRPSDTARRSSQLSSRSLLCPQAPVLPPEEECPAPARPVDNEPMSNRPMWDGKVYRQARVRRRIKGCASQLSLPSEVCGRVVFHSRILCGSAPFYGFRSQRDSYYLWSSGRGLFYRK